MVSSIAYRKPIHKILSYRHHGEKGKKKTLFFSIIFFHAAARGGTCAFKLKIVNTPIAEAHTTTGFRYRQRINPRPTRFTRPVNVDDGLDDIRWIRGLGGKKLPAASYALLPNMEKALFFAIGDGSRFWSSVLYTPAAKCFFLRRLAGTRHTSPAFV